MNNESYINKVNEYRSYIDTHIANVKRMYEIYGKDLCDRLKVSYDRLGELIKDHDESKYSKDEFEGFRIYYYPTLEEESDIELRGLRKNQYNAAWLHHLRNNAHHPEFWIYVDENGTNQCHPMDPIHVAEMILDWAGMGVFFKKTAYEYWNDNVHAKPLHNSTRDLVDSVIDIFKEDKHS